MQDFDDQLDDDVDARQFKVGGKVYTLRRRVHPSALEALDMAGDVSIGENMAALGRLIRGCLVFADRDRWDAALADQEDDAAVISIDQIKDVSDFCLEKLSGRPLDSAESSPDSTPSIVTPSPVAASSPEVPVATS